MNRRLAAPPIAPRLLALALIAACSSGGAGASVAPSADPSSDARRASGCAVDRGQRQPSFELGRPGHDRRRRRGPRSSPTEPRFAGIGPMDPDLIGQSAWYEVDAGLRVSVPTSCPSRSAGAIARPAASSSTPGTTSSAPTGRSRSRRRAAARSRPMPSRPAGGGTDAY